jgi:hypothetical protein
VSSRAASERRVLGRYVLGPAIGRGATSVVHRAHDLVTGDTVAVKVVPVELGLADRVRGEVRAAGRLDHPRIVALRDWGEDRECLYLVWELVEGPSLAEVLRTPGGAGDAAVLRAGEDLLVALAHAHARGVVHRDVKPANVLIGPDGRARLSDFGVARLSGEGGLTLTGGVVGTVAYMAPEQALGEGAGPEADVYAACLVLYEGLAGGNPNAGGSPAETARRAASGAVPPLARARPDLPGALCRAIDAGLRRDPRARPDAEALADEIAGARGGARAARRRGARALPALAGAAGGAALAGLAMSLSDPPLAARSSSGWAPAAAAAVIAVAAAAFAWRPRASLLVCIVGGAAMIGASAPAAGALLGALGVLVLASGWRHGRLTMLALAAPALLALGLAPLYPALAGLAPRWPGRLWAATAGVVTMIAWQVAAGADALLPGGGLVESAVRDLDGERSPAVAAERLWQPLADAPQAGMQALAMVVAAMCVPLVLRARPGAPRVIAAGAWILALGAALVGAAADPANALGAVIPAAIVIVVWAVRPWRALRRRAPERVSATLRGPIA